ADRVAREDEKVLANDRLLRRTDGFALELWDVHGLWGGESVRVHADGRVEGISVDRGVQVRHFKGTVEKGRVAGILKKAAELGTFDLKPKRQNGIPDEARPILGVQATIDGATYSRSVALWEGEVRETPAFRQVRQELQA